VTPWYDGVIQNNKESKMNMTIEKAYQYGINGHKDGLKSPPASNHDFINLMASTFKGWEDEVFKMRFKCYKAYLKGWTEESLKDE
jgi:hypothetical protein